MGRRKNRKSGKSRWQKKTYYIVDSSGYALGKTTEMKKTFWYKNPKRIKR